MHKHFPHIKTFVRAFDIENGVMLERAGATAVVPEILEPSLQLAAAVLSQVRGGGGLGGAGRAGAHRGSGCWCCVPPCPTRPPPPLLLPNTHTQINIPEDEVAEMIRAFRKNHLSELQALAQMRCGRWRLARGRAVLAVIANAACAEPPPPCPSPGPPAAAAAWATARKRRATARRRRTRALMAKTRAWAPIALWPPRRERRASPIPYISRTLAPPTRSRPPPSLARSLSLLCFCPLRAPPRLLATAQLPARSPHSTAQFLTPGSPPPQFFSAGLLYPPCMLSNLRLSPLSLSLPTAMQMTVPEQGIGRPAPPLKPQPGAGSGRARSTRSVERCVTRGPAAGRG